MFRLPHQALPANQAPIQNHNRFIGLNNFLDRLLDCMYSRSTSSMPRLPRSTGRPMPGLPAFATLSNS